mmetsp:Transcript_29166/g.72080  ORF Transcript_29166/g.72080 Transcript_29166/m.72080 type:complete len:252 (-) Transcript_29166:1571-2326(-)
MSIEYGTLTKREVVAFCALSHASSDAALVRSAAEENDAWLGSDQRYVSGVSPRRPVLRAAVNMRNPSRHPATSGTRSVPKGVAGESSTACTAMTSPARRMTMMDAVELAPLSRKRSLYTTPPRMAMTVPSARPSPASVTLWLAPRMMRAVRLSRNSAVHPSPSSAVVLSHMSALHANTPPSVSLPVSPRSVSVSNDRSSAARALEKCALSSMAGASLKSSGLHTDRSPSCGGPLSSAAYASLFRHPGPSPR